jgi:hypothetical protein
MNHTPIFAIALPLLALAVLPCGSAAAQTRVFVAAAGSDSNNCSFAQPCRTFQRAHDVVAAGGEINALDPAGYGSVKITKGISIEGHGFAAIAAADGAVGITISAGTSDRITLRGLILDGGGTASASSATVGIDIETAGFVDIDHCALRGFASGIVDQSNGSRLHVSNTLLSHMNAAAIVVAAGGSVSTRASISRVQVSDSLQGIQAVDAGLASNGNVEVSVSDSNVARSGDVGIESINNVGSEGAVAVLVARTTIVEGSIGVRATGTNAFLRVFRSTIAHNATGSVNNGATLTSWGNNAFSDNAGDSAPPLSPLR